MIPVILITDNFVYVTKKIVELKTHKNTHEYKQRMDRHQQQKSTERSTLKNNTSIHFS